MKFTLLPVAFSIFTVVQPSPLSNFRTFHHSKRNSIPLTITPHFPLAPGLATTYLLFKKIFNFIGV